MFGAQTIISLHTYRNAVHSMLQCAWCLQEVQIETQFLTREIRKAKYTLKNHVNAVKHTYILFFLN